MKEEQWAPVIVMLISSIAMGSVNALVKKALDVGVNHMIFAAYRMAISALILVPFSYIWERIEKAQNLIKSKAGVLKLIGTLICILGAMFLTFFKGPQVSNPHTHPEALHNSTLHNNGHDLTNKWLLGCLYLIIGTVLLSLWMLFQGKLSIKYPCSKYSSTCLMSVFAAFQCAILSLYKSREVEDWVIEDKFVIFVIIYAGIVGQAMSTVVTSWSIKMTGAVFVSTFSPISLVSATLFDFLILHSPLYLGSILGSGVTVTGLYVFLWGRKSETDQSISKTLTTSKSCQMIGNEDSININDNNTKSPV
ncbi:hypothetical protein EUTSA_v10028831mg [Eutrema salsugineum]|uniref:WAT1-related protein n=1 Tax=Eutrema salsugineum TaxID=72664 RepID=V4MYW1_EUTSA|nr:hypothetical protein EUTSA_v10028831mg [Eutrema salsugineum]